MLFYDPGDLAAVARGEQASWEPQPYATLNVDPYLYHLVDEQQWYRLGGAAYGYPTTYEVTLIDGNGRTVLVLEVEEPPLEVDSQLEDALIEDMSSDAPRMSVRDLEGEVYIPETWPFFDAVFSDGKGNLLVQRSNPLPPPDAGRRLDFFTAEGLYLYRLRVAVDDIQAVRNGFLYARRFDREMNVAQLVRYRILNWAAITEAVDRHRVPPIRPSASRSTRSPAP